MAKQQRNHRTPVGVIAGIAAVAVAAGGVPLGGLGILPNLRHHPLLPTQLSRCHLYHRRSKQHKLFG